MSLINEALKRAEADKVRNSSPYFDNLTVLTPVGDGSPPPPLPPIRQPRKHSVPVMGALGGALIAVGLLGAGYVWYRSPDRGQPRPAGAANPSAAPAAPSAASAAAQQPAPPREVASASRPSGAGQDAGLAPAPAPEEAQYCDLSDEHAAAGGPTATSRPAARPKAEPGTVPSPAIAAAGAARRAGKASPGARPTAAAKSTAQRARAASVAVLQRKFRVSAIMRGPEGNCALINGSLFREGQTVLGARILSIGRYQVELESAGQRFTIRM